MEDSKKLKKQLHVIKGQIEGVERMIDDNRESEEIYIQFKAIEANFQKTFHEILADDLRKNLASKLVKVVNACPGNCPDAEKIKLVQKEFPDMQLKKVVSIINEMEPIEKRLAEFKDERKDS